MDITYLIILGAVYLGLIGLAFLIWAIKTGQFEDMEGPKYKIFFEDDLPASPLSFRERVKGDGGVSE